MAFLDGLTDTEPRRTTPAAVDVIVTADGRTFVIFEGDRPHYIAWIDDVRVWLRAVARLAKLSRRERNWMFMLLTKATG